MREVEPELSPIPGPRGRRGVNLVMGVDGGQTATKVALATTDGAVLARGEGGGLIHLAAVGGRERFARHVREAIADAWTRAGLAPRRLAAIGLGLTGVDAEGAEAAIVAELLPGIVPAGRAAIQSDAVTALLGAHGGEPGIIAIAGTGSIVLGKDESGRFGRAGGWGWLLGDEGSAMAIGRDGLIAALQAVDGVIPATSLRAALLDHVGVRRPRDVKTIVYGPDFGARGFGGLAALVGREAEGGDAAAREIIDRHADLLARQVRAVVGQLEFGDGPIPVAPIGGAFEHVWGLRPAFEASLAASDARLIARPPLLLPDLGAVLLALSALGVDPTHAAARLSTYG
jgi:N-acetylglucosamine kinase-like BadF-type ATPase